MWRAYLFSFKHFTNVPVITFKVKKSGLKSELELTAHLKDM